MNTKCIITIATNYFKVEYNSKAGIKLLSRFSNTFSTFKYVYDRYQKRKVRKVDKVYDGGNIHLGEKRYTLSSIKNFMWLLRACDVNKDNIIIKYIKKPVYDKLNIPFISRFELRDYQLTGVSILTDGKSGTKLVDLATGMGKTVIALKAVTELNHNMVLLILPKYIDKWISDIKVNTKAGDDDIMVIRGSNDLSSLMMLAEAGETIPKFLIFSNRTIYTYIKTYETIKHIDDFTYPLVPEELFKVLRVGTLLIDEVHQEFYSVFKASLYFDVNVLIGLSATLTSDDPKRNELYYNLFPKDTRISTVGYKKYITVYAVNYKFKTLNGIRAIGTMGYSHTTFEQSILNRSMVRNNYLKMINDYVEEGYIKRKEKGDKILIFCATISLCTLLTSYLQSKHTDCIVNRYVEADPYENVMEGDIIISTVISAGTALDIPNLITVINTVSQASLVSNLQTIGRLRNIKGKSMEFYYLYSMDIPKQKEYHFKRKELFKPRALAMHGLEYKHDI